MGLAPTTAFAAEAKKFEHYEAGGFTGTVKWEVNQMLGCLESVTVPIDSCGFVADQYMDRVAVVRTSKTGTPISSIESIRNMKAMTPESGWVLGYKWSDKVNAFQLAEHGASYAISTDGKQVNLYQGNARLIDAGNGMMGHLEDKTGSSGGTCVFNYILLLSEEDEAYFLQHGTIPGCGNLKWPGLREMLLDSEPFSESAVRNNLKVVVEDKAPVEIDAFYYVEDQPGYIYPDKLEKKDFSTGAYYNPEKAEPEYYVKLRDLAQLVNGTDCQFSIGWNPMTKCMEIKTGESYQPIGTELQLGTGNRWADWAEANAIIDGKSVKLITDEYHQNYLKYTGTWIEDFLMIDGNYYTSLENVEKHLKVPVEVVNGQMSINAVDKDDYKDHDHGHKDHKHEHSKREMELKAKGVVIPDPSAELPTN